VETKVELQATSEVHKGENSKQTLEVKHLKTLKVCANL